MATPSFSQLKQINDLFKKIEDLKIEVIKLESQLNKVKTLNKSKEGEEKERVTSEIKQTMLLEKIKEELKGLREQENKIRNRITQAIDEVISKYFGEGHFAKFVESLLKKIQESKQKYTIKVNKFYSTYLPQSEEFETVDGGETFRIDLGYKAYVLDLDHIKKLIKEKLIESKFTSMQINPLEMQIELKDQTA
jgi:predicted RNase H-like nuclease (RuvC/YqgF family)